jgi:hypothetical protein
MPEAPSGLTSVRSPLATKGSSSPASWFGALFLGLALVLAPVMFGSVTTEAQGALGILLGLSLLCFARTWLLGSDIFPRWVLWLFASGIILSLVPLPLGLLQVISPAKAALARQFPLTADDAWAPVTLSSALTLRWLWQFTLLALAFTLTRQAMRQGNRPYWLLTALVLAVLVEVGAEWFFKGATNKVVLGIWPVRWGNSGGTFANRNHFACWIMIATVVLLAGAMRFLKPLRSSRPEDLRAPSKRQGLGVLLLVVAALAVTFALMSGSRSGLLALASGGIVLAMGVQKHSGSRRRGMGMVLLGLLLLLIALPFAGQTLDRLSNTKSETSPDYPKWRLWNDAVRTFLHFPVMGTGPGTFVRSNILMKTTGGESTAWHAENDVLQWLSEAGLWGLIVMTGAGWAVRRQLWQWYWQRGWTSVEPELVMGAFAGLGAMLVHSLIDFPFQVTANALLAAVLFGVIVGLKERGLPALEHRLAAPRHAQGLVAGAAVLIVLGALQVLSFDHFFRAKSSSLAAADATKEMELSLRLWPLNTERANYWLRLKVNQMAREPRKEAVEHAKTLRAEFSRYIALDPLSWELRLERAWLDIAFATDRAQSLTEARAATGLNPKQAQIPLRFAAALVNRDPEQAWEFLRAADVTQERFLLERLEIAWRLRNDTSELWSLVPATDNGYRALAEFGFNHQFPLLAKQALDRMRLAPPAAQIGRRFLDLNRPDLAATFMPAQPENPAERIVMAKIALAEGDAPRALRLIEPVLLHSKRQSEFAVAGRTGASAETLLRSWNAGQRNVTMAKQLAEAIVKDPADRRDASLLEQLAETYPAELRLSWLAYRTRAERYEFQRAAEIAITLAETLTAKP